MKNGFYLNLQIKLQYYKMTNFFLKFFNKIINLIK